MRAPSAAAVFWLALWVPLLRAQVPDAVEHLAAPGADCFSDRPADFEAAGYRLAHDAQVRRPAPLFGGFESLVADVRPQLPKAGDAFSQDEALETYEALKAGFDRLAFGDEAPFRIKVLAARIKNCDAAAKTLDLSYSLFVFSADPLEFLSFETREAQLEDSGGADVDRPAAAKWRGGVRAAQSQGRAAGFVAWRPQGRDSALDSILIEGGGSRTSALAAATLAGGREESPWIGAKSARWLARYEYERDPAGGNHLVRSRAVGQLTATTPQLNRADLVLRYGGSFEGGSQRSEIEPAGIPEAIASSRYTALKAVVGASAGSLRQELKASYGFQLGWTPDSGAVSYRKHVADLSHRLRLPAGDHRMLEIETDFSAGRLDAPVAAPVAERFFGGVTDRSFLAGDDWRIRAAPRIRSIPYNRLSRSADGLSVGGDSYVSLNFTVAWPVWRIPILPGRLAQDPEFREKLNAAKLSARSQLEAYHLSRDPSQENGKAAAKALADALDEFQATIATAEEADPDAVSNCFTALTVASFTIPSTIDNGDFAALGPDGDAIVDLFGDCGPEVEALGDGGATAAFTRLQNASEAVAAAVSGIDLDAVRRAAAKDFRTADRALDFFVEEMNMISVSPVFVFDMARLGPRRINDSGGLRYGVGGGVRFTLASHVNVTVGYAANPDRRPWESRGAWFASLDFLDLIR